MYEKFLKLGTDYIEQNLFLDISLEECAKAAGYSLYHYCRVFNAAMGITIKEYIRKRRVSEAAKMINETSFCLKEIAYRCGFNSQENFIRVFKSVFGINPNDYKKTRFPLHLLTPNSLPVKDFHEPDYSLFEEPKIVMLNSFDVAGKRNSTTFENEQQFNDIPVFWSQFYAQHLYEQLGYSEEQTRVDYGVAIFEKFDMDLNYDKSQKNELDFDYLTGVKFLNSKKIPEDMEVISIPSGLYAEIYHRPANDYNLIQNIIDTCYYMNYYWFPNSDYEYSGGYQLNEYCPQKNRLSKAIYMPLKPKEKN